MKSTAMARPKMTIAVTFNIFLSMEFHPALQAKTKSTIQGRPLTIVHAAPLAIAEFTI
jgi:hypothetical protein